MDTTSEEFKKTREFYTGTDLECSNVYSAYNGTAVLVGDDELGKCVIVQTGSSFCIAYKHLADTDIRSGQYLDKGTFIGSANKYVHVELLQQSTSIWPVRIGAVTWFKNDTAQIFDHSLVVVDNTIYDTLKRFETFVSVESMLSDNGGPN
jgi:murein DD-endopeptidase MepM/ murein hydrolase activator NlpD